MCWCLAEAGLGGVPWEEFRWTEETFDRLQAAVRRLAVAPVVILPGRYATRGGFYSAMNRAIYEFGVVRVVAWDRAVVGGLPLSLAPHPWGWKEAAGLGEDGLLVLPHV